MTLLQKKKNRNMCITAYYVSFEIHFVERSFLFISKYWKVNYCKIWNNIIKTAILFDRKHFLICIYNVSKDLFKKYGSKQNSDSFGNFLLYLNILSFIFNIFLVLR